MNVARKDQNTALLLTAKEGHSLVAEQLLAKGADVRVSDAEGMTALLLASNSEYAQSELVKLLLAKGANVKDTEPQGNTALMLAARAGAFQVIEALAAGGAEVNAKNKDGSNALQLAKESKVDGNEEKRAEVIRLLLKAGAKE